MSIEAPILRTKSIYTLPSPDDGYRISVMSRHTLQDGVTPDSRISATSFHAWMKQLAPPEKLIGSYYKRGLSWEEFETSYCEFLRTPQTRTYMLALMREIYRHTVTILCVEESPAQCHRRLLAEECVRMDPAIQVEIS